MYQQFAGRSFSGRKVSSIADHDRADPGTVPAVAVTVTVPVAITVMIPIPVPEHASIAIPIAIVVVVGEEAARPAEAVIAIPATDAFDLFDEAQLVLRRLDAGRAADTHCIGAIGPQRRAQ
jgi:hypothetical protein